MARWAAHPQTSASDPLGVAQGWENGWAFGPNSAAKIQNKTFLLIASHPPGRTYADGHVWRLVARGGLLTGFGAAGMLAGVDLSPFCSVWRKEMRRKRLQHQADIFCQMFCGWRLCNSHEAITASGSGALHIDVLTGTATHNGTALQDLNIAGELNAWFQVDLRDNCIPVEQIRSATLDAELIITDLSGSRRSPVRWNTKINRYLSCDIRCRSHIETDETSYASEMVDHEEWPDGWWNEQRTT